MSRIAALDLGTNSTRFLCLDDTCERIKPSTILDRETEITRIGSEVDRRGLITEKARSRVLSTVESFNRRVNSLGGEWIGGLATSACRRAQPESVEELFREIESMSGVRPRVIDGKREACLTYIGVRESLDQSHGTIMDIGGGSTEWITFDSSGLLSSESLPVGIVTLKERCGSPQRYTEESLECLENEIESDFNPTATGRNNLVTVGGTGTTLAALDLELNQYRPEQVHNHTLTRREVRTLLEHLQKQSFDDLSDHPLIRPGREDVLVPGVKILETGLEVSGSDYTRISDLGILAGFLAEYIRQ